MNITNRVIRTVEKRAAKRERKVRTRQFFDRIGEGIEKLQAEEQARIQSKLS